MFARLAALIVFAVALAVVMLSLRQQRFEAMHEMAELHREMNAAREAIWDRQVEIAARTRPQRLERALESSGAPLEPVVQPRPGLLPPGERGQLVRR